VREVRPPQVDTRPTAAPPPADSLPAAGRLDARSSRFTHSQLEEFKREFSRAVYVSAKVHAERLLRALQEADELWPEGWPGGELRASHVKAAYSDLCEEEGWVPLTWQRVGEEFRRLLGCGRVYRSFYDLDGRRQTLVVYPVPPARSERIAAPPANDQRVAA
jgi:hypothetical protein